MNENDNFPYIAFLRVTPNETSEPVTAERLEYAFHTFSLRNEKAYAPTGDVTFASPNPDSTSLVGGVERLVHAVLTVDTTAVVLTPDELRNLLGASTDTSEIEVGKGIVRSRDDLEALHAQSLATHNHEY